MEAIKEKPKIIKKIKLKNLGDIYKSSDLDMGNGSITVLSGHIFEFSLDKAVQVLKDFPKNWEFVSGEDDIATKQLQDKLSKTLEEMKSNRQSQHSIETDDVPSPKKPQQIKPVSNIGQIDAIVSGIRKAEVEAREIKADKVYAIVSLKGFTPIGDYEDKVEVFNGEIGANWNSKTRYIVVEFKKNKKKKEKELEVIVKPSKDIEPSEIGASELVDDEDELDEEDKHKPKKARRVKPKATAKDDEDEDEDEEDDE